MLNVVAIEGRVCFDPELKKTSRGVSVLTLRVASERRVAEKVEKYYFNVVCWNTLAEFAARYFPKGQPIAVTGHLASREYTTKDGFKRDVVDIVADHIDFPVSRNNAQNDPSRASQDTPEYTEVGENEEIPF